MAHVQETGLSLAAARRHPVTTGNTAKKQSPVL
jgi:hypothetical protein